MFARSSRIITSVFRRDHRYVSRLLSTNAVKKPLVYSKDMLQFQSPNEFLDKLKYIGRENNSPALRHLKHLLLRCNDSNDIEFAVGGVQFYQEKGLDFSEEVCTLFVNTCIDSGDPMAAAQIIAKYNHRMGAWLTKGTSLKLLTSLADLDGETKTMVDIIELTIRKGLRVQNNDTVKLALSKCVQHEERELFDRVVAVGEKVLTKQEMDALKSQYPFPEISSKEEVEDASTDNSENKE